MPLPAVRRIVETIATWSRIVKQRAIAANDAPRELTFGIAPNVAPIDGEEEWKLIAPYGEHAHPKGRQRFQRTHADKMVTAFNSVLGRLGRLFRGVPIYRGHPDVDPKTYPDDRRLGRVDELRADEQGLWGRITWNSLGRENCEQGFWVFPSPAWLYPRHQTGGVIEPDELFSVGLTNTPNIPGSAPWTNANDQPGAERSTTEEHHMTREELIAALGLAANATDEQIRSAFTLAVSNAKETDNLRTALGNAKSEVATEQGKVTAANGQLTALQSAKTEAETKLGAAKDTATKAIKTIVANAVKAGKITQADAGTHEAALAADFDAGLAALEAKQPAVNTKEITLGDRKQSIASASERQTIIANAVNEEMQKNGGDYARAFATVKGDSRYKAVFQAMEQPKGEEAA